MAKQFKKPARNKIQKVVKKNVPASKLRARGGSITLPTGDFIATVGRRKTAAARVRLYLKPGDFIVNGKPMTEYFNAVVQPEVRFMEPFRMTETVGQYAVSVKVDGSGSSAQLDAVVMGIARALVKVNESHKKVLRDAGFLTRDSRMKETRKPGRGGKARAKRQSPKR